jgi:hypothetical protein
VSEVILRKDDGTEVSLSGLQDLGWMPPKTEEASP